MTNASEMTDEEFRDRVVIESDLHEELSRHIWDDSYLYIRGVRFRPVYAEEAEELGYSEDDSVILLRRGSDGAVFEIEIDVTARKTSHVLAAAGAREDGEPGE